MAGKQNFVIEQGASFKKRLTWRNKQKRPINLTGYTAKLQARSAVGGSVLFELSTANGGIALTPTAGIIDLIMTAAQTAAFGFATVIYDLILTAPDGTTKYRVLEGRFTLSAGVTQ